MRFSDNHNFIRDLKVLPKGWRWTRLIESVDQSRGICYGIVQPGKHDPQGTPMINSQDIKNGIAIDKVKFYVSNHIHQKYRRSTIEGGELLLTLVGANFGQVGIATPNLIGHNCSRAVGIIPITESALFVSYCLRGPVCRHFMDIWANTTAQPTFNLKDVENLPIPQPPSCQRNAITHILETLDKRIELNQKNNKTLEEIAKALFKSWFIDFDPVRAKANGDSTGLPDEISDLFPNSFEDSQLGEIPAGWQIGELNKIVRPCGQSIKPSEETLRKPYVPIDCITSKSLSLMEYKSGEEAKSSLLSFGKGDILFGAMRPYFHKVCIAPFEGITRSTCIPMRSINKSYYSYSTLLLSSQETIEYATQHSTGSTIPYIRWNDSLEKMPIVIPPKKVSNYLEMILAPLFQKVSNAIYLKNSLQDIRDTLLPKLISGELRVPNAEKIIEEVDI